MKTSDYHLNRQGLDPRDKTVVEQKPEQYVHHPQTPVVLTIQETITGGPVDPNVVLQERTGLSPCQNHDRDAVRNLNLEREVIDQYTDPILKLLKKELFKSVLSTHVDYTSVIGKTLKFYCENRYPLSYPDPYTIGQDKGDNL